jgi:predicted SPOUT superfamily RNA methylase MTH1
VFWGYKVSLEKRAFGCLVKECPFDLKVATARVGENFRAVSPALSEKWVLSQSILVAFGAPSRGLHEITDDEGLKLSEMMDFVVNTVPNQGTATVRTEEALLATLAILNAHFSY